MKKTNKCLAAIGLAIGLAQIICADSTWNGTITNNLWSNPNNWSPVGVPPPGNPTTTFQGNVWLDPANGDSTITLGAGDVESPGVGNTNEVYNTIFGPEWGATLNIYGTLNYDWFLFPVQNDPTPGKRSLINIFTNGVTSTAGAALGVGDSWWNTGAPYVTVNLYGNAQHNSLGGAGLWLGGHLNIYDVATVTIGTGGGGYVNMDTAGPMSDGTRSINMGGGTLILPPGFATANVGNWIARGILRAYGKGLDANDLVITDNGTNVVVSTVPLGGALQQVYFQTLLETNMGVGSFQQSVLVGDYPAVIGVLLSSPEPGLSPASFSQPIYTSSNPKVVAVDSNGMISAVSPGNATLTAKVGALNTTNSLLVTVTPLGGNLIHRYSFSESSGATSADMIPGNSPTWDATLNGGATLGGGQVTLDGSSGYVQLPAGILNGLDEVTIQAWASFGSPISTWANVFAFGDTDGNGEGENYIGLQRTASGTSATFGQGDPGNAAERDAVFNSTLDGQSNVQVTAVYHPLAGYEALYINGLQVATISMFNNQIDPVACAGPTYNGQSILAYTLGQDNLNYIGHSLYDGDPTLNGTIDEFRIYNGCLNQAEVTASYQAGPNNTNYNPGKLVSVTFSTMETNLPSGLNYTPTTFANYEFATNVPIATDSALALTSSNTNVVNVVGNQLHTGVGGSATVSAFYEGKTASLTVYVLRTPAVLLHRWNFNESSGTIAHDLVGGADGTLQGSAAFTGSGYVNLPNPGSNPQTGNSYVTIPGGLLNNLSAVTVECWVTNNGWNNGNTFVGFSGPIDENDFGTNYINFYARMYSSISAFEIATTSGDSGLEALGTRVNDNGVASGIPSHYVYVYDPTITHTITLYTNGVLAGSQSGASVPLSSLGTNVGTIGLSVYSQSQSYTLTQNGGSKINCPYLNGGVNEVRIYNGILTAADVAATQALGPDLTLGSNTAVSLEATTSGDSLNLTWPVSAATFGVLSSPTLGADAVWTPVSASLTVVGGSYSVTLPLNSSNQFFRLQQH